MGCLILRLWIFSTLPANQSRCRADPFFLHEFPTIPMTPSRGLVPAYQIFVWAQAAFFAVAPGRLVTSGRKLFFSQSLGKASKVPLELNLGRWVDTSQINSQTVN
jgi:hypothetical protein